MNKLTITRNGVTVQIEQDTPMSADIIVETIKAMDKTAAPVLPWTPPTTTTPWTIPGATPYNPNTPWRMPVTTCGFTFSVTPEQLEERRKKGLLSYTNAN